jgi:predicted nucleic acid-binding protein
VGRLILPPRGIVYLDANAVIDSVEHIQPHWRLLRPLWTAARRGTVGIATSELTWLECLVKPLRTGDTALEARYKRVLTGREVSLLPATRGLWESAARLRALGLKTPDALHAATALGVGCASFVTNDNLFRRVPGLPVEILSDVLTR